MRRLKTNIYLRGPTDGPTGLTERWRSLPSESWAGMWVPRPGRWPGPNTSSSTTRRRRPEAGRSGQRIWRTASFLTWVETGSSLQRKLCWGDVLILIEYWLILHLSNQGTPKFGFIVIFHLRIPCIARYHFLCESDLSNLLKIVLFILLHFQLPSIFSLFLCVSCLLFVSVLITCFFFLFTFCKHCMQKKCYDLRSLLYCKLHHTTSFPFISPLPKQPSIFATNRAKIWESVLGRAPLCRWRICCLTANLELDGKKTTLENDGCILQSFGSEGKFQTDDELS